VKQESPLSFPQLAKMISGAGLGRAEQVALGASFCMALSLHKPAPRCKDKVAPLPPDFLRESFFDLSLTPQFERAESARERVLSFEFVFAPMTLSQSYCSHRANVF
jgi:hypothetical protein